METTNDKRQKALDWWNGLTNSERTGLINLWIKNIPDNEEYLPVDDEIFSVYESEHPEVESREHAEPATNVREGFTPGNWFCEVSPVSLDMDIVSDGSMDTICTIDGDNKHNAALISQAPALYYALKDAIYMLGKLEEDMVDLVACSGIKALISKSQTILSNCIKK